MAVFRDQLTVLGRRRMSINRSKENNTNSLSVSEDELNYVNIPANCRADGLNIKNEVFGFFNFVT
ncbi:hypothetical protein [Alicyclobacillus fastidiosus]|uniref:hypothetical protein n=1 Tax=Alicyclobacillus fastidiosus TaxID=392011 RepID=UPI0023E9E5F8|nr:hypothetical protein [Alicyclobacillus fastidiosus]GMA63071.1 hypothetical protein GCM10025859_35110 [Alicyclobacillus fastidiosus]